MTYVSGPVPAQVEQDSVSPPGDRRRAFSPERAQSGSKYHPYYVVGGQQDRRPLPLQARYNLHELLEVSLGVAAVRVVVQYLYSQDYGCNIICV